ncbi:MAG: tRNA-dihydrouridine synthase [Patescibacteria group bacterium]|nr:tRNA-dihydrouridine synthase [Patescibacteria group bacterium]
MKKMEINFGFWQKVKEKAVREKRPIFVLAPMADVTDAAFRRIIAKYSRMGKKSGGPDVLWTEFVSADGLCSPGREVLLHDLAFSKIEHPIVVQLFTSHPDKMRQAAALVAGLGFDGVDINMGCPDRSIEKQGAGAAMMKDPKAAVAVIAAAREGAADISISVKTRIGYNKVDFDWLRILLEQKLPVLTVHLRTRKEMSLVPAHWELMPEIVKMRNEISPETILIGNGDVESLGDGYKKVDESGCDGVMFGRAIFGNPWLFDEGKEKEKSKTEKLKDESNVIVEKLHMMVEHTKLFEKLLGEVKNFAIMKKHFKAYVNGWDSAKELRVKLMETTNADEVKKVVDKYVDSILSKESNE